ncbi:hypothetical protein AN220_14090, partial [Streptomyces nanshensis]
LFNDRRRSRRNPDAGLDDEEAAPLDLTPEGIGTAEGLPGPRHDGEDRRDGGGRAPGGFDDAT